MFLQLLLGAALTSLGSKAAGQQLAITILAAANTVIAGLLALMHNSGLPDRLQKDFDEFDQVESYLKELMETGIVRKGMTRDEVVENCFARFRRAKKTVTTNKPSAYSPSGANESSIPNQAPHLA